MEVTSDLEYHSLFTKQLPDSVKVWQSEVYGTLLREPKKYSTQSFSTANKLGILLRIVAMKKVLLVILKENLFLLHLLKGLV